MIKLPKHTLILKAYPAGKSTTGSNRERSVERVVKLSSNENPIGASPKAVHALAQATDDIHRYADPLSSELVDAIARYYSKKPSQIMCAHGADAILAYIINAFTSERDEVLTSEGTFVGIYVSTNRLARELRKVPLRDYAIDLERLAGSISDQTRIIYLANPNNPTGTMFSTSEFESFMRQVPDNVLVVLDEAYEAYASQHRGYPDGMQYEYDNLLVVRSFSKQYGLAGLRVGFVAGSDLLIEALLKVKLPFEPHYLAQVAALAALEDDEFRDRAIVANNSSIRRLTTCLDRLGIPYVVSVACFILLLMQTEELAQQFMEGCLAHGLIIRQTGPFGIPNGVRVSSGSEEDTSFAIRIIETVWQEIMKPVAVTLQS